MRTAVFSLALSGLLALICTASTPEDVRKGLQGTWTIMSVVDEGETVTAEDLAGRSVKIDGDKIEFIGRPDDDSSTCPKGTFSLDPAKEPCQIDVQFEKVAHPCLGICLQDGDQAKLCISRTKGERPKAFESPEGSKVLLMVLERDKK